MAIAAKIDPQTINMITSIISQEERARLSALVTRASTIFWVSCSLSLSCLLANSSVSLTPLATSSALVAAFSDLLAAAADSLVTSSAALVSAGDASLAARLTSSSSLA